MRDVCWREWFRLQPLCSHQLLSRKATICTYIEKEMYFQEFPQVVLEAGSSGIYRTTSRGRPWREWALRLDSRGALPEGSLWLAAGSAEAFAD